MTAPALAVSAEGRRKLALFVAGRAKGTVNWLPDFCPVNGTPGGWIAGRDDLALGDLRALSAHIAALEAALAFYADPKSYAPTGWQGDRDPAPVMVDRGKRAIVVLGDAAKGTTEATHGK